MHTHRLLPLWHPSILIISVFSEMLGPGAELTTVLQVCQQLWHPCCLLHFLSSPFLGQHPS